MSIDPNQSLRIENDTLKSLYLESQQRNIELQRKFDLLSIQFNRLYQEVHSAKVEQDSAMQEEEEKESAMQVVVEENESIPTRHTWTESELNLVVSSYRQTKGNLDDMNPDVRLQLKKASISDQALIAQWEHCRFLDTGYSLFTNPSKLLKRIWKKTSLPKPKRTRYVPHQWTENELEYVSKQYPIHAGNWTDEIESSLFHYFHGIISTEGIYAKWEACRFLHTGSSEFDTPSRLHTLVWEKL